MVEVPYPNGLAACMARARVNDPKLAAAVGSTRQQIHKLRHGERKLTVQWAKRLAPHLDCTWQELIEGPRDPADAQRADLLATFDAIDPRDRETLLRIAQSFKRDDPPTASQTHSKGPEPPRPFRVGGRAARKQAEAGCEENVVVMTLPRIPA